MIYPRWTTYEKTVLNAFKRTVGVPSDLVHLPPDNNYVWKAIVDEVPYILKLGACLPYRLHREVRAYQVLETKELKVPDLITSGEIDGMPFLLLSYCGDSTVQDMAIQHGIVDSMLIESTCTALLKLSECSTTGFEEVKLGITTQARDKERLAYCQDTIPVESGLHNLLCRIAHQQSRPYRCLAHRDFSPRQVVVGKEGPFIIDFESIGPGAVERDLGDFLGGFIKFTSYHGAYGRVVKNFAQAWDIDFQVISDYTAFSLLWSITTNTKREEALFRLNLATEIANDKEWLTSRSSRSAPPD